MSELAQAAIAGADPAELLACPVPATFRAAHLRRDDVDLFGSETDRDVRRSIRVGEVPMPELAPDEVLVAVMAIEHQLQHRLVGDLPAGADVRVPGAVRPAGPVERPARPAVACDRLRRGGRGGPRRRRRAAVDGRRPGGGAPAYVDTEDPPTHDDSMIGNQRAWGFETNFGGLADFAVVKASQLLPKPAHLTWEEAACNTLCASTAYRMLVSQHGARMKQGDVVLIWGATGGLGGYAVQLVLAGGGIPVAVVSSEEKAQLLRRLGCRHVINRAELPGGHGRPQRAWRELGKRIRRMTGEDPHIVFEYTGAETFGASVYLARPGGTVVTCGSSSGYEHQYDNRYPLDAAQAHHRQPRRQLPGGGGAQPPAAARACWCRRCPRCIRWTRSARRPARCSSTSTSERWACSCLAPHERWASTTR